MINSEDVKESIVKQLIKVIGDRKIEIYKETITNPSFPNFFIYQISVTDEEERKNHHILTYHMDVRYRVVSDIVTESKLQQNLDEMSLKLLQNFNTIDFNDSKVRCLNKSIEKADGVLHFFFDIRLEAFNPEKNESTKLGKLEINLGVN